jgi:Domain of unknown function (DUF4214)
MQKIAVAFSVLVLLAAGAFAQSAPTLRIVTDDPTLPSELFYGNVKVKPVRLRPGTNVPITIDDIDFFVQEHYIDFLARFPEPAGFQAWMNVLTPCNGDTTCLYGPNGKRVLVSQSFFGSPEFLIKGIFTITFYRAAFNRLPDYTEFVPDVRSVTGTTAADTNAKRAAFAANFVLRPEFVNAPNGYGAMSNSTYVTTLMGRYSLSSITTPDPANPDGATKVTLTTSDLINGLNGSTLTRAQVLRAIVQSDQVTNAEAVNTFVASQYYGYLRRTPDTGGYNSWVNYLNTHPGDFNTMVWGFVDSQEYRNRF